MVRSFGVNVDDYGSICRRNRLIQGRFAVPCRPDAALPRVQTPDFGSILDTQADSAGPPATRERRSGPARHLERIRPRRWGRGLPIKPFLMPCAIEPGPLHAHQQRAIRRRNGVGGESATSGCGAAISRRVEQLGCVGHGALLAAGGSATVSRPSAPGFVSSSRRVPMIWPTYTRNAFAATQFLRHFGLCGKLPRSQARPPAR